VKRVNAVTPEEVKRIANEYLTPDKMTLVIVGDEKTVKTQVTPWTQR
jgi:predicted Zn-dependent peptidase